MAPPSSLLMLASFSWHVVIPPNATSTLGSLEKGGSCVTRLTFWGVFVTRDVHAVIPDDRRFTHVSQQTARSFLRLAIFSTPALVSKFGDLAAVKDPVLGGSARRSA